MGMIDVWQWTIIKLYHWDVLHLSLCESSIIEWTKDNNEDFFSSSIKWQLQAFLWFVLTLDRAISTPGSFVLPSASLHRQNVWMGRHSSLSGTNSLAGRRIHHGKTPSTSDCYTGRRHHQPSSPRGIAYARTNTSKRMNAMEGFLGMEKESKAWKPWSSSTNDNNNCLDWVNYGISWVYLILFASLYTQLPGLFSKTSLSPVSATASSLDCEWF